MKLHYRIDGQPGQPPLILLNGLFADLNSWERGMAHLRDFRVLRFDGRGQGLSPKPEGVYDLETLVQDLLRLLLELDWPPSFVVGVSHGGSLGLELARRCPDRVKALVAADCHHRTTPLMALKLNSWLKAHQTGGPVHRFDIAAPWIWSESVLKDFPSLIAHYRDKAGDHEDQAVLGLIQGALRVDVHVEDIRVPTLLLAGEEDVLTPPFSMRSMPVPNAQFQTVPGGHASLLEQPEIFRDTIVPFLKGLEHVD